jgi:hypothetical protein
MSFSGYAKLLVLGWAIFLTGFIFANNKHKATNSSLGTYIVTINGSIFLTVDQDESSVGDDGSTKYDLSGKIDRNGSISSYNRSIKLNEISDNTFQVQGSAGDETFTQTLRITGEKGAIISGSTASGMTYILNVQRINHHRYEITGSRTTKEGDNFSISPIRIHSKTLFDTALGFEPSMLILSN